MHSQQGGPLSKQAPTVGRGCKCPHGHARWMLDAAPIATWEQLATSPPWAIGSTQMAISAAAVVPREAHKSSANSNSLNCVQMQLDTRSHCAPCTRRRMLGTRARTRSTRVRVCTHVLWPWAWVAKSRRRTSRTASIGSSRGNGGAWPCARVRPAALRAAMATAWCVMGSRHYYYLLSLLLSQLSQHNGGEAAQPGRTSDHYR